MKPLLDSTAAKALADAIAQMKLARDDHALIGSVGSGTGERKDAAEKGRAIAVAITNAETALLWFNKATQGAQYRGDKI